MVESIMLVSLGFLLAGLLALMLAPLVHERAVRLTSRSILATAPSSMAEIQADKDHLRAEFAMSTQRLEGSVENLKAKATCQLAEIAKKTAAINRLKVELDKKSATILALQAREHVRKSITRRIVKLLLFIFVRSHRRRGRVVSIEVPNDQAQGIDRPSRNGTVPPPASPRPISKRSMSRMPRRPLRRRQASALHPPAKSKHLHRKPPPPASTFPLRHRSPY